MPTGGGRPPGPWSPGSTAQSETPSTTGSMIAPGPTMPSFNLETNEVMPFVIEVM